MLRAALLACLLLPGATARAAEPPSVLPFDQAELEAALSARVPQFPFGELMLTPLDGRVVVTLRGRVRVVDLGEARDAEAARVLALVIADVSREEPVPAMRVESPAARTTTQVVAPLAPVEPDRARLGLDAAGQRGLASEEPWSFDFGVGASALFKRRFVASARLGYMNIPNTRSAATHTNVRFDAITLRPALGIRMGPLELNVGPSAIQYWSRWGEGQHDLLLGAHAQLMLWLPVVNSLRIVARLGFDVFGNRNRLYAGGDRVLTTPRSMLGLALGFAWGWS